MISYLVECHNSNKQTVPSLLTLHTVFAQSKTPINIYQSDGNKRNNDKKVPLKKENKT